MLFKIPFVSFFLNVTLTECTERYTSLFRCWTGFADSVLLCFDNSELRFCLIRSGEYWPLHRRNRRQRVK